MIRLDEETPPAHDVRRRAWEDAAAQVLARAGRSGLDRRTDEGLVIPALADPTVTQPARGLPGEFPYVRGASAQTGWDVRPRVRHRDPVTAAGQVIEDLERGATSVWLTVGGDGVPLDSLGAVLADVDLAAAPVVIEASGDVSPVAAAEAFADLLAAVGVRHPRHQLGLDPYGSGRLDTTALHTVVGRSLSLDVRGIVCDGTRFADQGAGEATEIGVAVAAGLEVIRAATDAGFAAKDVLAALEFRLAVTDEQFVQVAKLRAARLLWAGALARCGIAPEHAAMRQHAVTARPMLARHDSWTNLMRTTIAAFAGGVGGAESMTVLPFDVRLGQPSALGRRLARNISTLLLEEAHVAVSADPAGGAYAVETLTDTLAAAAWQEVRRIEGAGGLDGALADGSLADRIAQTRAERRARIRTRRRPLTGISEFPLADEVLPAREPWEHPDPVHAWGEDFEALRDEPVGTPVLLATMGPAAAHTARASFAHNLCAAGGIRVVAAGATTSAAEVAAALREAGTTVAILCGTDDQYAQAGPAYVTALRDAGATHVVLAGVPRQEMTPLVDGHIAAGQDAVAACEALRAHLSGGGA